MNRVRLPILDDVYQEKGLWKLRCCVDAIDENGHDGREQKHHTSCIGPATGPNRLTKKQAQKIAYEDFLFRQRQSQSVPQSEMTLAHFVETIFVPEHVNVKRLAGRAYYQSILKHVLPPEKVDRIFRIDPDKSKTKLIAIPDWPYLDGMQLHHCGPEHVKQLISAALVRGYSVRTVIHIRNVVGAIFSLARKRRYYQSDNPVRIVKLPELPPKNPNRLSLTQAKEVLEAMRYPEKEMTLIAILTNLNIAEICGLQWKYINLTGSFSNLADEPIPPLSIAVRKRWYRVELDDVKGAHVKNLPIPGLLLPMFLRLSGREKYTGPDDYVLVSRAGTPINAINITARRLRTIGDELRIPWLSWHVFRRNHAELKAEFGSQFYCDLAGLSEGSV
jgi:integrase